MDTNQGTAVEGQACRQREQHISKVRSWASKAGDRAGRPSSGVKDFGLSS